MSDTATRRIAWFHCFAGIAGDMALGSLVDAGADFDAVLAMLEGLAIRGWSIKPEPVLRSGIAGTHMNFRAEGDGVIRTFPAMRALIEEAGLPARVRIRSIAALSALANVEAHLHRRNVDQVHFHELAGYDTILDIVGTMAAFEVLEIDEAFASPVATGTGMIKTEHGHLPNPAPAVLELLKDAPIEGRDIHFELTTPTGAAILSTLVRSYGTMPPMRVEVTGYGAGSKDLEGMPNLTQVVIGTVVVSSQHLDQPAAVGQPLALLETNIDDATGEQLGDALSAAFAAGAADAWVTPVIMKKGRPGHVVSVLVDLALAAQVREVLIEETGTFGVRSSVIDRWATTRHTEIVDVDGEAVRVKVSPGRVKVEHDDAAQAARALHLPVRQVVTRAEEAFRKRRD